MSRVAKYPVKVPAGVEVKIDGATLTAKGGQGTLSMPVHDDVVVAAGRWPADLPAEQIC